MNRSDLIARMTERLGGDRAAALAAVTGVLEEIEAGVARGERVTLNGFGTFERRARAARTARNPRTGEAVQVEATAVPVFRAATGFKSLVHLPDGAPERPQPASAAGDGQARTGTTLQVVAAAGGKKGRGEQAADEVAEAGGKARTKAGKKAAGKAGKKAAKAAKGKAGKKSA